MIRDILRCYYDQLLGSGALHGKTPAEKKKLFCTYHVDFPLFIQGTGGPEPLPVDFAGAKKLEPDDPCFCRSGRPYMACCGRTPGEDELKAGL